MGKVKINGVELEYEVQGSGEPVLLIGTGPIADSFVPFFSVKTLSDRYRLVRYHQRGQAGSTHCASPVSFAEHAADAAALLSHLGVRRAHVAGHSTGALIALQLATDRPDSVQTLALLEPPLVGVPSAGAFFEKVGPALAAYGAGDREGAMAGFLSAVSGLDWETCRTVIDTHVPGGVAQAMKDVDTFFGSYLPALSAWQFGPEQAAAVSQPVLSVLGTETEPWFVDGRGLLHTWFPQLEDYTIEGIGHLLHMQRPEPAAQGIAEFLARHPLPKAGPGSPPDVIHPHHGNTEGEDTMIATDKKNLACPDEVMSFERGRLALLTVGGATVGQAIFDPGWKWSEHVGPAMGATSCALPHLGYVVSGRLMIEMADGTRLEMGPGDVATIPGGHDGWTVGDEPCVFLEFPVPTGE